jgi:hypothetical protein
MGESKQDLCSLSWGLGFGLTWGVNEFGHLCYESVSWFTARLGYQEITSI